MSDHPLAQITEGLTEPVSKVAIALIDKIGSATGILYKPIGTKREAKAEAKAEKIQAEAKIEITDLHRRAAQRWIEEETQRQESIENTITKSIPQLNEDADPNAIEDDWIIKFFDKCRLVTDDKVQDLWASILAGEANSVGAYSPKTLTTLADMNQKSLTLFNAFCSLCIVYLEDPNAFLRLPSDFKIRDARVPIIRNSLIDMSTLGIQKHPPNPAITERKMREFSQKSQSIYRKYGFDIDEFELLSEYGLIQDETLMDFSHFWYNNEIYIPVNPSAITPPETEDYQQITVSGFRLSSVGRELFHITKRDNPPQYLEHLIDFLEEYYDVKIYKFPKKR